MTGPVCADTETASRLRHAMVEELIRQGDLRDARWIPVFRAVPRHCLVPRYHPMTSPTLVEGTAPEQTDAWLHTVYSDTTLITQRRPDAVTSSGTMPGLIALMLHALDIDEGHTVLQAGTGTGYTAALLSERLGSDHVVSIDIDPDLTEPAQQRLQSCGYHPDVVTADAASGYPPRAPYDRVMATFAVPSIPPAWLRQTRDGGVVLAPIHSALARLTVRARVAEGRFLASGAYFMRHRPTPDAPPTPAMPTTLADGPVWPRRDPQLPSSIVWDHHFRFIVHLTLPELIYGHGARGLNDVILTSPDGSQARHSPDGELHQTGPRRLWNEIECAHDRWQNWGSPHRERFGLTATPQAQWAWLDDPHGEHRWPIAHKFPSNPPTRW